MRSWVLALVIGLIIGFAAGYAASSLISATTPILSQTPRSFTQHLRASESTTVVTTTVTRSFTSSVTSFVTVTSTVTKTVYRSTGLRSTSPSLSLLIAGSYESYVLKLLSSANSSVYVMMFVAKYYPGIHGNPANELLNALCRDAARGIDVRVLLDYTSYREYRSAIQYLEHCGVKVRVWRECGSLWKLHAKVVIVDGRYVVLGSHNWTYSALAHNIEVSVAIRSRAIASELTSLFQRLWSSSCSFTPR